MKKNSIKSLFEIRNTDDEHSGVEPYWHDSEDSEVNGPHFVDIEPEEYEPKEAYGDVYEGKQCPHGMDEKECEECGAVLASESAVVVVGASPSVAQPADTTENNMAEALIAMRFAYMVHEQGHWESMGQNFYSDHEMFSRAAEMMDEDYDQIAERAIGLYGNGAVSMHKQVAMIKDSPEIADIAMTTDVVQRSVKAEQLALEKLECAYNCAKETGDITLGLDDLLMALCSRREEAIYLLGQRSK